MGMGVSGGGRGGRRHGRRGRAPMSEINVTPLVDVMLVLQGRLPQEFRQLASMLGVQVRENVGADMLD